KLPADYLERTGYRLPTEAEWEYACRAGAVSSRPYGRAEEWLGEYGWYVSNSGRAVHPTGRVKPNDLGVFDILSNALAVCCDPYSGAYEPAKGNRALSDALVDAEFSDQVVRVQRGGTFDGTPAFLRSADRNGGRPTLRFTNYGLRPARTYD